MSNVLVFVETRNGTPNKASLQAVSAAAGVAQSLGGSVTAAVIGACNDAGAIGAAGAGKVLHVTDAALANYSQDGYALALQKLCGTANAQFVVMAATSQGKDLAPRLAAKLDAGLMCDVTSVTAANGSIVAKRPVFAGKSFVTLEGTGGPLVITLRPNVFALATGGGAAAVETMNLGIADSDLKSRVTAILAAEGGKQDVAEAEVIVSGGRGMKGPEHWALIEELAKALGAATGASRAVVDAGWRPHSEQVGQTGKTVSPKLYVAVGISGAIQHLAGMSSSKCIVAINKDPQAPIFKVADYGIVGDAFEVLPKLTAALKALGH